MYVLKQGEKYLSLHKETGTYELSTTFNDNVKVIDKMCDAIKFAEKFEPMFKLKVKELKEEKL